MPGCLIVVASLVFASENPAVPDSVRPQNDRLRQLVAVAVEQSATFRALVTRLTDQRVIVYIVPGTCEFGRREACLPHRLTVAAGYRLLQVVIRDDMPPNRGAGVLAHELQHAVEVAEGAVFDVPGFEALYRRIGHGCEQQHTGTCYETDAAPEVQARVVEELSRTRADRR